MNLRRSSTPSLLHVHIGALALLGLVNLVLLIQLIVAWHTMDSARPEQIAQMQQQQRTAELQAMPLRDLPTKLTDSSQGAEHFYDARVPTADSAILAELGALAQKTNVRLSRLQYGFAPSLHDLTEVRMDATVSGDYTPVMRFINSLERDKMFFVINGLTLSGQQGGMVNLRLRVTTYLHGAEAGRLPASGGDNAPDAQQNPGGA